MNIAREKIVPPVIPFFEILREVEPGKSVAVVEVGPHPNKPCRALHGGRKSVYIRVGSTVREPGDEELMQMFQSAGRLNFGKSPVTEVTLTELHQDRIRYYLTRVLGYSESLSPEQLTQILINLELMTVWEDHTVATVNGVLLFGKQPRRALPQAGIRAVAYRGTATVYDAIDDVTMPDPLVPARDADGRIIEGGLIERALSFIAKHCPPLNALEGARNVNTSEFPVDLVREVIVNAVIHRDYTIAGTDILLAIYSDRIELTSPGRLPNGATVDALRTGFRYHRNQTLANILRDYRYFDALGMGIHRKVIPLTRELTGEDPQFRVTDYDFTIVLPRPRRN